MFRILPALAMAATLPAAAHAQSLERLAAQVIRDAGYWCAAVSDVIPDQWNSTPNKRVVIVACDDGREYARYEITMNRSGTAATVKEL
jgi:hypothetical protein